MVAPLTGSVDRNIASCAGADGVSVVAPLAGSVDRNVDSMEQYEGREGRSPRGERG